MTRYAHLPWRNDQIDPTAIAVRVGDTETTYDALADRVGAVAAQLESLGVGRGDVVALMLPNGTEFVAVLLGAWRIGATVTPINPTFTANEADYQITDAGSVLVVNLGPDAPTGGVPALHLADLVTAGPTTTTPPPSDIGGDVALLIYTSGSTGRPKGVILDHDNVDAMITQITTQFHLTSDDHALLILPLFHVNAIAVSLLSMLAVGGELTVLPRFSPDAFLAAVVEHRPTYFSAVPTIYALLVARPDADAVDTSSLRFALCGAAPVSKELLEAAEARYGFTMIEGYGLTEGTCASSCNPLDGVRKFGTVGPALVGQQIRIAGTDGASAPTGEAGEVLIKGPNVMRGYLNRPEETAATVDDDGWLHTGDVGVLDEDGYLTLVDRIKDMIIRGGENLYPKEIENALATHPAVLETAVIGAPDATYGEVPVAYVVLYPDADVTGEALRAHAATQLTKVKVPQRVHVVDGLPKNPVGKIDKPTLRRTGPDLSATPVT